MFHVIVNYTCLPLHQKETHFDLNLIFVFISKLIMNKSSYGKRIFGHYTYFIAYINAFTYTIRVYSFEVFLTVQVLAIRPYARLIFRTHWCVLAIGLEVASPSFSCWTRNWSAEWFLIRTTHLVWRTWIVTIWPCS